MSYQKETKQCQNCKQSFTIEPEDFEFYSKIQVPSPTFCPECRLQRRLAWRNERTLYKRKCDAPGHSEEIISIYHKDSPLKVYDQKYWWSDEWIPIKQEYDFNASFFEQFNRLFNKIPNINLWNFNAVNSDYCNYAANTRDCYLFTGGKDVENVLYSNRTFFSNDSIDNYVGRKLELCYENIQCDNSYRLFFSKYCNGCNDSAFLYGCRNCQNCFGCVNLRNKQYHIFNKPYSKESYFEMLKHFSLGSFQSLQKIKLDFYNNLYTKALHQYAYILKSRDSTGDNIYNAKNCKYCFDISGTDSENCKYIHHVGIGIKDSYDNYGVSHAERVYETLAIGFESNENSEYYFSYFIKGSNQIYYSYNCVSCSNLFACIGLRNKQYCILNKQYTKEEYEKLVPKIIEHMNEMPYIDKKGRVYKYGEFFPMELSPFAYNETIAQEYFPLTKEQAIEKGYSWKEQEKRNYIIDIKTQDIPDNIKDVDSDIIGKIIECEHQGKCNEQCPTAFKIIEREFEFYKKQNIPIPRLCPNCRHYQRIKQRNPLKLWHRKCQCAGKTSDNKVYENTIEHPHKQEHCTVEFETSYAPERKEIVYCEKCYQQEVA